MKVSWTACTLLLLAGRAAADCREVSADLEAEFPLVAGLDSALALAANLQPVTFCLAPSAVPFTVGTAATVQSVVVIRGNSQVVNFLQKLEVKGSLAISNATLVANSSPEGFSLFALLGGSLHIEDSSVAISNATLVQGSGALTFTSTNFTNITAPVIFIYGLGETSLQIQGCVIRNHTGEFLLTSPLIISKAVSVSISESTITGNQGSGFLVHCSVPLLPGNFTVSNTEFTANSIPLFYFNIGNFQVSFTKCTFQVNNQTTLTLYGKGSVLIIEDSLWSGNSQILFDFQQFTGDLQVYRITVTDQRWKGVFQLRNNLSPDLCRFSVQNSSFLDTYFKVNETSPGIIHANGCIIVITASIIDNVRMAASRQRDVEGLVMLRFGQLVISQVVLHSSGAAGTVLAVGMANFTLSDSLLLEVGSGGGLYATAWAGTLVVHNVNISHGAKFPLDEESLNPMVMPISSSSSHLKMRNVRILVSQWYNRANGVFAAFSTVDISGVEVHDRRYQAFWLLIDADGSISNVTMRSCLFDAAAFYVANSNLMRVSDVTISDCIVGFLLNHGIFGGSPRMNLECTDLRISNVTAVYLAGSKQAQMWLKDISITDSTFNYFLKNQLDSNITIENMSVSRSTAVIAFLYRSSLRIADSVFRDFASNSIIFGGESVNITLDNVVIENSTSPSGFSRFKEKSQLTISQSTFSHYRSAAEEGFFHDTGSLSIINSTFRSFNTVFIQARSCLVYIGGSAFQEGGSKALSRTSASAYGGALACIDCPSVEVENSSFLNVSAIFGGAIAVRSTTGSDTSSVTIDNCEFLMCAATAGGAVYVKEALLDIAESRFIGNGATLTGGAIEVSNSKERSTTIRNCQFYRSSAHEGGAVKWSGAEVSLINATFQDNTAFYGPDLASYGIVLIGSVISSESNGIAASGYPVQLIFELQDHYGQRVLTASTQDLLLSRNDNVGFFGNSAATISQGIFNFSQLTIYAQPNSTQTVSGAMSTYLNGELVTINASVDISFRECRPGEVRKRDRCEYCFAGNVSFFPSDSSCSFCPNNSFCPGGNVLLVNPHYWRNSTNSTGIVQCPLRANCLGGQYSDCAEGYTGQVCNECSEDYTRQRTLDCEPCQNRIIEWVKVCLAVVPIIAFTLAVEKATNAQLFILKQIVNHAQMLSVLSYLRVSYPSAIKYSLHSLSYLSSLFISELPISCFSTKQPEYLKAIIGSILPPALILLSLLLYRRNLKKAWVLCTSLVMFTPMISLTSQMPLLACQSVLSNTLTP